MGRLNRPPCRPLGWIGNVAGRIGVRLFGGIAVAGISIVVIGVVRSSIVRVGIVSCFSSDVFNASQDFRGALDGGKECLDRFDVLNCGVEKLDALLGHWVG